MLDNVTKRRIDSARQILVGKVPDPKAQVEQITTALIYKFMDDMDKESQELGGKSSFFNNGFEIYSWTNLLDNKLSGQERMDLYVDAITKMASNPHIPQLFRDIFKGAFLPFRDPRTLTLFLKEINEFNYDHSENLGDAFEYLLSVLGSQGNAGQFRTPRHIIDFIVRAVDPKKDESILDPACGTAGFLISSYKHIMKTNSSNYKPQDDQLEETIQNSETATEDLLQEKKSYKGDKLTPSDKTKLKNNISGYDISPDMVKLSLVNLYLHGFSNDNTKIFEYDTLTSLDRWDDDFDVVLANPPFMTPKGGISPHKRFSVQANRSEVLFVDYIAEHLTISGRAGIIVPEGIIFQSSNAYKKLRKNLIDNWGLYAVVSLPSGVFQPYSGVKTSILLLDRSLAKKTNDILFVKVENDGFDLGAQRRKIDGSDLPKCINAINTWKKELKVEENCPYSIAVSKDKMGENGDYNLTAERYRETIDYTNAKWPMVELGEVCEIQRGGSPRPINEYISENTGVNWIKIGDVQQGEKYITKTKQKIKNEGISKTRLVKKGDFILSNSMSFGRPFILKIDGAIHDGWLLIRIKDTKKLYKDFLYLILGCFYLKSQYEKLATGGVVKNLNSKLVRSVNIPLPPLDIQKQIVEEIDGYQKVIDGANQVIQNWKPTFRIDPEWPILNLCSIISRVSKSINPNDYHGKIIYIGLENIEPHKGNIVGNINSKFEDIKSTKNSFEANQILYGKLRPNLNKVLFTEFKGICSTDIFVLHGDPAEISHKFYSYYFIDKLFNDSVLRGIGGSQLPRVSWYYLSKIQIPHPPLEIQMQIVKEIESERQIVDSNKELIEKMQNKIDRKINEFWEVEDIKSCET